MFHLGTQAVQAGPRKQNVNDFKKKAFQFYASLNVAYAGDISQNIPEITRSWWRAGVTFDDFLMNDRPREKHDKIPQN